MTLRQEEGFRDPASLIDRGKIELGVHPILALGGKDKPTAILAPVMEAIALIAVHFFEFTRRTSLQIHQPQIGIVLRNRKIASAADTVHQPSPIVGGACQYIALIRCGTTEKGINRLAKLTCSCIERNTAERALHLLVFCWHATRL